MTESASAYGLWSLVIINSVIFIFFAFSFTKPRTRRDWRSLGAFSAFIVALFTENGFPLTIYLLWLGNRFPGIDWFAHDSGRCNAPKLWSPPGLFHVTEKQPIDGPEPRSAVCLTSGLPGPTFDKYQNHFLRGTADRSHEAEALFPDRTCAESGIQPTVGRLHVDDLPLAQAD